MRNGLVATICVLFSLGVFADDEFKSVVMVDSKIDIYQRTDLAASTTWIHLVGESGGSFTTSYDSTLGAGITISTSQGQVTLTAPDGYAFGEGECIPEQKIQCSPTTLACVCWPSNYLLDYCDTDDIRPPVGTVLAKRFVGSGCE